MSTTAQKFYLGIIDDDQTGGTTIKKIQETAPATTSTTTDTWSAVAAETRTLIPLAGSTTNSNTADVNAWDFNNGGADGLGSTATAERWIKSGVWSFSMDFTLNAPALLQTIACAVTARVYRVATGGGARALLFTAASANFSATGVITWNSASQPEYILAAGEVIQVGFTAVSGATQPAAVSIVPTVLTTNLGANSFFNVPAPGVRTLGEGVYALAGAGSLAFISGKILNAVYSMSGVGTLAYVGAARFSGVYAMSGVGALDFKGSSVAGAVYAMNGVGTLDFRVSKVLGAVYTMGPSGGGGTTTYIRPIFVLDD